MLGIDIEASEKNLIKLQNGLLDLNGQEKAVKDLIDVHKMAINMDWDMLRKSLETITTDEFRNQLKDSNGHGWVYSWFCMDHVGFTGENPRRRDVGYHHIFDKYMEMVKKQDKGDIVQFHHHPVSHSGNYHECGTAFWGRSTLNDILTRRIIDRSWFPTAFRPGFHTERPDSHWFLEQWIPFDYGNQAMKEDETNQLDMMNGRFGDWRKAPIEWKPYHPSHDDYQKKGNCHRWITKCLNMNARIREISQEDVLEAFKTAQENGKAILAFTDHDYKDMKYDIERVRHFLKNAMVEYPKVKFEYTLSSGYENGEIVSNDWKEITPVGEPEEINDSSLHQWTKGLSYKFAETINPIAIRITFSYTGYIGLNECEVMSPSTSYYAKTSADLSAIKIGNTELTPGTDNSFEIEETSFDGLSFTNPEKESTQNYITGRFG